MADELKYYAVVADAEGRIAEVLVTRRDGKHVSQVATGVFYSNAKKALRGLREKNAHLSLRKESV